MFTIMVWPMRVVGDLWDSRNAGIVLTVDIPNSFLQRAMSLINGLMTVFFFFSTIVYFNNE